MNLSFSFTLCQAEINDKHTVRHIHDIGMYTSQKGCIPLFCAKSALRALYIHPKRRYIVLKRIYKEGNRCFFQGVKNRGSETTPGKNI